MSSDSPRISRSKALAGIAALRDELGRDNPEFQAADAAERKASAFCSGLRRELRALRESRDIDQAALGERMGLSQSAISKIETGRGDVGLKTLCRYADALGFEPVVLYLPTPEAMTEMVPGLEAAHLAATHAIDAQAMFLKRISALVPDLMASMVKAE